MLGELTSGATYPLTGSSRKMRLPLRIGEKDQRRPQGDKGGEGTGDAAHPISDRADSTADPTDRRVTARMALVRTASKANRRMD
jgi:hypothetical protein